MVPSYGCKERGRKDGIPTSGSDFRGPVQHLLYRSFQGMDFNSYFANETLEASLADPQNYLFGTPENS